MSAQSADSLYVGEFKADEKLILKAFCTVRNRKQLLNCSCIFEVLNYGDLWQQQLDPHICTDMAYVLVLISGVIVRPSIVVSLTDHSEEASSLV